jgi:hypothetical protein
MKMLGLLLEIVEALNHPGRLLPHHGEVRFIIAPKGPGLPAHVLQDPVSAPAKEKEVQRVRSHHGQVGKRDRIGRRRRSN